MLNKLLVFLNKVKTAYRRLDHPEVGKDSIVIDIGAGNNPYPKANVLCDFISENSERTSGLNIDRPFVWGNIESLPFKDGIFDYSIASHIIEHVDNPQKALDELQRISKAGYIETPNAYYEYIIPHVYHVSRCTIIDNKFVVSMKKKWDDTFSDEYYDVAHDMHKNWHDLNNLNSRVLLTRYHWKGRINYLIRGFGSCEKNIAEYSDSHDSIIIPSWKKVIVPLIYKIMRPSKIVDLQDVLACPKCKGNLEFGLNLETATCNGCNIVFNKFLGHLDFRKYE